MAIMASRNFFNWLHVGALKIFAKLQCGLFSGEYKFSRGDPYEGLIKEKSKSMTILNCDWSITQTFATG